GDLFLSGSWQSDGRCCAQRRPAYHPDRRPDLLRRGADHQHGRRCLLCRPQSQVEGCMMSVPQWMRSGRVITGLVIVGTIAIVALLAPWLAPHDPNEQALVSILLPPAWMP